MAQAEAVTALVFDARPAEQGAISFAQAGERIINTNDAVVTATERVKKANDDSMAAYNRLSRQLDPFMARQQQYERSLGVLNRAMEKGRITGEEHGRMLGILNQRHQQYQQAAQQMAAANDQANGRLGKFSQVAGQAGFQMQDLATQIAGGTNAFVALGQQLPQFLGAFGTGGAIAGAVVAVGALAANFLTMGDAGARAMEKLIGDFNTWSASVSRSTEVHEAFAKVLERVKRIQEDLPELSRQNAAAIRAETANVIAAAQARVMEAQARLTARQQALEMEKGAANDTMAASNAPIMDQINLVERAKKQLTAMRIELDLLRAAAGEFAGERGIGLVNSALEGTGKGASVAETELEKAKKRAQEALSSLQQSVSNSEAFFGPRQKETAEEASAAQDRLRRAIQLVKFAVDEAERYFQPYEEALKRMEGAAKGGRTPHEEFMETIKQLNADLAILTRDGLNPRAWDLYTAAVAKANAELAKNTVVADADRRFQAAKRQFERDSKELDDFNERQALAREGIDRLGSGLDRFLNDAENGVFDLADAAGALWRDLDAGKIKFEDMGDAIMESAQAGNALANILGSIIGRSAEQNKNAQKGGAIGATVFSTLGLPKGLGSFFGNLAGGMFGMSKADERAIKLAADVMKYTQSLNDFVSASAPLSAIGSELSALDSKFGSLMAEAKRLKQPVEDLTRAYEVQRRAIGERVANDNLDRLYRATGQEWRAELRALTAAHATSIQDALLAESSLSSARAANAAELSAFFEKFTASQLVAMGDLVSQLDMVKARIRDLTGTLTDQIDKQIDTARQLASAARQAASAWRELAQAARDQILSNATGELSPLSPMQQFQTLSAEFQRLFTAGSNGDVAAGRSAIGMSEELLRAGRALYASGPDYAALYAQVQGQLQQLALNGDIRATAMDQIAALADVQVTLLTDIRDILNTDLGQPTAQAIAAAIADGVLTVGEIQGINGALTELGNRFAGITGPAADAVRQAIVGLQPLLTAGALTPAQRDALTTGQTAIATALSTFRATQLEEYRQALIAAGTALSAMQNFVLDPNGAIPAAITAAFAAGGNVEQTLAASVQAMFTAALGPAFSGPTLTVRADTVLSQAVGGDFTLPTLTVRADQTFAQAIGEWSGDVLSTLISSQFGAAIADWASSTDPRTLTQRVNELFAQAIGATGTDWEGALKSLLDQQSPIVSGLSALAAQIPLLIQALTQQDGGASQAARDAALQAYVTPVQRAINAASQEVLTTPVDERSGSHNNRTIMAVDIATGAGTRIGGNKDSDASRARATQLGGGLAGIARQIELLTGGTLSGLSVQAGEENSGYRIGSVDRIGSYAGNDYTGILRGFIRDAIAQVGGVDQAIRDILAGIDFTNVTSGFSQAAQAIWNYRNPVQATPTAQNMAATARPANDNLLARYNEGAYLASNPDVAAAVAAGWFGSGLEHFQRYGLSEAMAGQRIPGFAAGGYHMGGLRIVGERGPELEATGPARYFPADQTARMLGGDSGAVERELRELRVQNKQMQAALERLTQAMIAGQEGVRVAVKDQVAAFQEQTAAMRRKAG